MILPFRSHDGSLSVVIEFMKSSERMESSADENKVKSSCGQTQPAQDVSTASVNNAREKGKRGKKSEKASKEIYGNKYSNNIRSRSHAQTARAMERNVHSRRKAFSCEQHFGCFYFGSVLCIQINSVNK